MQKIQNQQREVQEPPPLDAVGRASPTQGIVSSVTPSAGPSTGGGGEEGEEKEVIVWAISCGSVSRVEVRFMSRNLEVCHHFFATNTLAKSGGIFRSPVPLSYHLIHRHYCNREQYVHLHLGLWRPIPRQRPLKV